jgi:hypothetical protein
MRWSPIILDLVFTVAVWTLLLWLLRVQRARMGDVDVECIGASVIPQRWGLT